jgi:hypothetical protein
VNTLMNFPLVTDQAALRLVASSVSTSGWIDRIVVNPFPFPSNTGCAPTAFEGCARGNVAAGPIQQVLSDSNWSQLDTARANLFVQPNDVLRITALGMYQRTVAGGYTEFDSPPGPEGVLAHYQPFNSPEPYEDYVRLWDITIAYDFTGYQLTYTNAEINNPEPQLGIAPGTPVLNIPKYTASAALMYARPIDNKLNFTARAAVSFTGSLTDEAFTYVQLPSYTLLDARLGILADRWTVYLAGTNLTNRIAELTANNTAAPTFNSPDLTLITTNQPRTIGINANTKF